MDRIVLGFNDFLNEDINFTRENGVCRLEDRWFYYNVDDDIIYGLDEKPVWDDSLFAFNPRSCKIIMNGEEKQYDVNNPICLITYNTDDGKVEVYTDETLNYLKGLGFDGEEISSERSRNKILDIFENNEDVKRILLNGVELIASTFDVIEEN